MLRALECTFEEENIKCKKCKGEYEILDINYDYKWKRNYKDELYYSTSIISEVQCEKCGFETTITFEA